MSSATFSASILIADIGGTNARFALAADNGEGFESVQVLQCSEYESLNLAVDAYLQTQGREGVDALCFAAAGPIVNQTVSFTNNHWVIDAAALKQRYKTEKVRLLNDFESISYSLPSLSTQRVTSIGGDFELPDSDNFTLAVLGPGTGLGVGGLMGRGGELSPLVCEGGHTGFAPENSEQLELLRAMQGTFKRVSNERLLSGPGLMNIYHALCMIDGVESSQLSAAEIFASAQDASNKRCERARDLFFEILGQVAGDAVLTIGAFDGVYIAGGICQRYPDELTASAFRRGFESKGRHSHLLEETPSWLVTERNPGLLGASAYSRRQLV